MMHMHTGLLFYDPVLDCQKTVCRNYSHCL